MQCQSYSGYKASPPPRSLLNHFITASEFCLGLFTCLRMVQKIGLWPLILWPFNIFLAPQHHCGSEASRWPFDVIDLICGIIIYIVPQSRQHTISTVSELLVLWESRFLSLNTTMLFQYWYVATILYSGLVSDYVPVTSLSYLNIYVAPLYCSDHLSWLRLLPFCIGLAFQDCTAETDLMIITLYILILCQSASPFYPSISLWPFGIDAAFGLYLPDCTGKGLLIPKMTISNNYNLQKSRCLSSYSRTPWWCAVQMGVIETKITSGDSWWSHYSNET